MRIENGNAKRREVVKRDLDVPKKGKGMKYRGGER